MQALHDAQGCSYPAGLAGCLLAAAACLLDFMRLLAVAWTGLCSCSMLQADRRQAECCARLQAALHKEIAAQAERKGRASGRADKMAARLKQQRPQDADALQLDIELAQLRENNKALLQVRCWAGLRASS